MRLYFAYVSILSTFLNVQQFLDAQQCVSTLCVKENWRRGWDLNPRPLLSESFRDRPDQPLWHLSCLKIFYLSNKYATHRSAESLHQVALRSSFCVLIHFYNRAPLGLHSFISGSFGGKNFVTNACTLRQGHLV